MSEGEKLLNFRNSFNYKTLLLINVTLGQALIVVINGVWAYYGTHLPLDMPLQAITTFSLGAGGVLAVAAIWLIREIYNLAEKGAEAEANKIHLEESKELVDVLRINRHDYLNHLQVIMGYIQLNKSGNAVDYIKEVMNIFEAESTISNLKHPEVAALLLKELNYAEQKNIELLINTKSDLHGLIIPSIELSRVIGNLLRNAFAAVEALPECDKQVEISFAEDKERFTIEVINKKPLIPKEIQSKVFEKGFTTKGISGSGLGLFIVKELTEKNEGTVKLKSNEEAGTIFIVSFPNKREKLELI